MDQSMQHVYFKKTSAAITPGLIEKFIHSENMLLKETALYAQ